MRSQERNNEREDSKTLKENEREQLHKDPVPIFRRKIRDKESQPNEQGEEDIEGNLHDYISYLVFKKDLI